MMSMREPTYYTLAALLDGPLHGYAIIKRAAELSSGRVRLAAGTLYAALDRLTETELVRVEREEIVNGRARRYYRLTDAGRRELETEAARMAEASRVVTGRAPKRRPTPGGPDPHDQQPGAPLPAPAARLPGRLPPTPRR